MGVLDFPGGTSGKEPTCQCRRFHYRPQFYFRTTDVTGVISLPEGTEMCMPGDNVEMDVELITPIAIEEGLRFAIREGGRTVGSGVVVGINA